MKKLLRILSATMVLVSLCTMNVLAANGQDQDLAAKPAVVTKEKQEQRNAMERFKKKYPGVYNTYSDIGSVQSPDGTVYLICEVAKKTYGIEEEASGDIDLKVYLLALKQGAKEYEVLDITPHIHFVQTGCYGITGLYAPTDERVFVTYINHTIAQRDDGNYNLSFEENHGLLLNTQSMSLIKDVDGGMDIRGLSIPWGVSGTHAYTIENISEDYDERNPKANFKAGTVRAYSLKDGKPDTGFKIR